MKKIYGILSIVSALALIVCMLISSLDLVAYYEPGFYEKEYRKYNVQEPLKMEITDILYVTDEMMDYLKGYRADLVVETTVDGKEREFFNDREKSHMADVRDLFLGGIRLRRLLLLPEQVPVPELLLEPPGLLLLLVQELRRLLSLLR